MKSTCWPGLLAPNRSTLFPKEALAFMFCALVFLMTSISFVVMLLMEVSVKESDGIRKDQIYPPSHGDHDAPWSILLAKKVKSY